MRRKRRSGVSISVPKKAGIGIEALVHLAQLLDRRLASINAPARRPSGDCGYSKDCQPSHSMIKVRDAIAAMLDPMILEEMVAKR